MRTPLASFFVRVNGGKEMTQSKGMKGRIIRKAKSLGASLVNFAPAARWDEYGEVQPDYRPKALWDKVNTVIVIGVPMLLPVLESTPSINYQEMYNTSNVLLDQIGPVMDALRVALAHQQHDRAGRRRRVVGKPLLPVRGDKTALGQCIDIRGERQRDDVRLKPVQHGTRLRTGSTV